MSKPKSIFTFLKYTLFLLFVSSLFIACEKEEFQTKNDHVVEYKQLPQDYSSSSKAAPVPPGNSSCTIGGPTTVANGQQGIEFELLTKYKQIAQVLWTIPISLEVVGGNGEDGVIVDARGSGGTVELTVEVEYYNQDGSTSIDVCTYTVTILPAPCTIYLQQLTPPCYIPGAGGNFTIKGKYEVNLNNDCAIGVDKYVWDVNDGSLSNTQPNVYHLETSSGVVWVKPDASCHMNWLVVDVAVHFDDGTVKTTSHSFFIDCD